MITEIIMDKVVCYKKSVTLSTDKRVNLIYGLNGTGKSIISDYLYHYKSEESKEKYRHCEIKGLSDENVLVYNQNFIKDYFYESDALKGIFTLSKENKEAETTIRKIEQKIKNLQEELNNEKDKLNSLNKKLQTKRDEVWKIKTEYAYAALKHCFTKLKNKEELLSHLLKIAKPPTQPAESINQLKKEAEILQKDEGTKCTELPVINISINDIESNKIFQKAIVGDENSAISELIKKLNNSDWVKKGLDYIPKQ